MWGFFSFTFEEGLGTDWKGSLVQYFPPNFPPNWSRILRIVIQFFLILDNHRDNIQGDD